MAKNKLQDIQEMLFDEMKRLSDNNYMMNMGEEEIQRSQALSNSASTYIKSVGTSIKVIELASKSNVSVDEMMNELGINE